MTRKEEIKRSVETVTNFFASTDRRLPAIMQLIKELQDGLHKPLLDHTHKMFFGEICNNLKAQEVNIRMSIDNRPNFEIAKWWHKKLMELDYQLREKRVASLQHWENHPAAQEIINALRAKI